MGQHNDVSKGVVSIIVPVYNREEFLAPCLQSIYQQDYKKIEIIIIDDASTIPIASSAKRIIQQSPFPIKIHRLRVNSGSGVSREQGRLMAIGEFIQYLDSDDLLSPSKLGLQVKALRADLNADVAYGRTIYFSSSLPTNYNAPNLPNYFKTDCEFTKMLPNLFNSRLWATSTPLYRATLLSTVGPWSENRICEDIEYDFRVALKSRGLVYIPTTVALVREHDNRLINTSSNHYFNDQIKGHASIAKHVYEQWPEEISYSEHTNFSLNLFFMARKAASSGLTKEMHSLLKLFRKVSHLPFKHKVRFKLFWFVCQVFGFKFAGKLSDAIERQ